MQKRINILRKLSTWANKDCMKKISSNTFRFEVEELARLYELNSFEINTMTSRLFAGNYTFTHNNELMFIINDNQLQSICVTNSGTHIINWFDTRNPNEYMDSQRRFYEQMLKVTNIN